MIKTAHESPNAPNVTAKVSGVQFRAVPCMGPEEPRTLTPEDLVWTHVKLQVLGFTAHEASAKPGEEQAVKVSNAGTALAHASLTLGAGQSLQLEPADRNGTKV